MSKSTLSKSKSFKKVQMFALHILSAPSFFVLCIISLENCCLNGVSTFILTCAQFVFKLIGMVDCSNNLQLKFGTKSLDNCHLICLKVSHAICVCL